ncbi:MAG: hypothetical protein IJ087_12200, partial [Eggerthellaceae bacterium]|nr:hypothetical protein [Eggerthellaceae bacterium]
MCWWAGMLKRRNPSFLKIMHYFGGVSIAIMLVYGLVTGNANGSLLYALIGALSLFLWTLYYVKSVRVRTYFGSDEYLRQSPFTKNIQGPTPAVPD